MRSEFRVLVFRASGLGFQAWSFSMRTSQFWSALTPLSLDNFIDSCATGSSYNFPIKLQNPFANPTESCRVCRGLVNPEPCFDVLKDAVVCLTRSPYTLNPDPKPQGLQDHGASPRMVRPHLRRGVHVRKLWRLSGCKGLGFRAVPGFSSENIRHT